MLERNLLVENAQQGGVRTVIHPDSLPDLELRGFRAVGRCSDPSREPLLTDEEYAAAVEAENARIAALLKSDAAPATSRPRK